MEYEAHFTLPRLPRQLTHLTLDDICLFMAVYSLGNPIEDPVSSSQLKALLLPKNSLLSIMTRNLVFTGTQVQIFR
jgi:hypothetical protein